MLLTYSEAADKLHIAAITLRKWVSDRKIPFLKLGRSVRFDPEVLQQWLNDHSIPMKG